ncbi:integrin alpha-PS2-like isoform X1 [Vespa mandarinia]|uniref:integrin alpha-PS2-like isoform X1 n=2 Tax=Vespa mandarinia TaxID=7446 RepID=UPI00160994E1|nr:integrin alpha-PS2-like isoform X1 [Vespa mandarinia]XP_035735456.1 integrin alpha-PS2-like isoform X1 [Vespa mandarinia]XP_035735464.1 integrin alpha-PS2-like isoform X1 [Vespa mandarinia]
MSSRIIFGLFLGLFIVVGSPPTTIEAFNVETKHYAIYRNEAESMFGFAVSAYRDKYGRGWAIVGAPEADTSQVGVYRGGAVYRCDIAADDRCDIIHFDDKGNNHARNPSLPSSLTQVDNKTFQWFGATVSASSKDGGPIMACAPRYIWFSLSQPRYDPDESRSIKETIAGNRRDPVGTCWVVDKNFNESQEFSPCRTRFWGYHRQGSCQAGLGAAMAKNGERLFIGAPGSWYWQGQLYSISTSMRFQFVATTSFLQEEVAGQAFSQPLNSRAKMMSTKEAPANEDDSYMGYSVAAGDFVGNGDSGTAVGVPRGSGLRGKVVLFTSSMTNHQNVTGEQMGAYFGYSVAAGDIDGDSLDDLIVGAPMYTIPDNPEMNIETGRIYVVYQGGAHEKFRKVDSRDGESNRGRFGLSLAFLGDIDHDGYGDFVVGAPYGGINGRGAVYIYHGSKNGVLEKYSQAIHADELNVPIQTFGFSVAGSLDLDGNHYPDLVVGAYESNSAFFFRARPVIKMDSFVTFETESKLISLDDKNYTLSDGTRVTSLPLRGCFRYNGDGVASRYVFNVQYVVDVKKTKAPRLFFIEHENKNMINKTITLEQNQQLCRTVQVYVTPNIRDKLTSLEAELRISLKDDQLPDNRPRDPRISLRPVIGATMSKKDSLSIRKNCGPDNVCIPDLQLSVKPNVERYLLGSGKKLELEILVINNGEDAFEATYNIQLPAGIDYIKIERIDKTEVPVQCSAPKQSNNNTLRCDIGNPLPQRQLVNFKVLLQPVTSNSMAPSYEFYMEVNTTNPENGTTTNDNSWHLSLPIWIETELLVEGESRPKEIYYNPSNYTGTNVTTESEFGPAVIHNYIIYNQGPSDILEAEALLIWPAQTLAGEELLYLIEQPEMTGPIACETANANYLSLQLDQRRRPLHQGYPDPSGVILDESHSGKTINVQRGFETLQINKSNHKEESDVNSGDSSDIQKSRHSSSSSTNVVSSETRRIQLTSNGEQPGVLTTTYTQNSSGMTSNSNNKPDGISGVNRAIIFHSDSDGYSGSSTNIGSGLQTTVQGNNFDSNLSNLDGSRNRNLNYSRNIENHWRESGRIAYGNQEGSFSSTGIPVVHVDESEYVRQYKESLKQQEQERRQQELETLRIEEEARLRRVQEQRRLEALERVAEEERLLRERKQQEYERLLAQRRQEEERREEEARLKQQKENEEDYDYDDEKVYDDTLENHDTEKQSGLITGDREHVVGSSEIEFRLRNISSNQELEKVLGSLSKEATGYQSYNRQGKQYVQFMGRFRTSSDRKEYIEFQDGSMFPLQDHRGVQSYVSVSTEPQDSRFLRIEGQLLIGQDGKGYIVLKDGRRFPLQGSYTYTEERTYTLNGGPGIKSYSRSRQEGSNSEKDYETRYSSHVDEHKRTEDRQVDTKVYGRNHFDLVGETDPNHLNSRFRRENDALTVKEFRKFEEHNRHRREIDSSFLPLDENNPTIDRQNPCNTTKCVTLRCVLGPLKKDQEITIAARYLVNIRTLKKVAFKEKVKVSSQLIARVTKQPFIGTPVEQVVKSHEIYTNIEPTVAPSSPDDIPLWIVVLSACAGAIILLLLIYLLHKCGFFKRNRPSDAPERQPLNRNGHFQQGDEHL